MSEKKLLLVFGAASHLSQALSPTLAKHYHLLGVDIRPCPSGFSFPGSFFQLDYTKRAFQDIFRKNSIWGILHLGRIKPTRPVSKMYRFHRNVLGTDALLRYGWSYGVKHYVIVSTHQVYGALKENHLYLKEDETLQAGARDFGLVDAVEIDHEASVFLWKKRSAKMVILRPVHVIGPDMVGPLMQALRGPASPVLLGFDPLMQFIHQDDMVDAIVLALEGGKRGVFNVAGEGLVPYSTAVELAGSKPFPSLGFTFPIFFKLKGYKMPRHFLDNLKYPIVVSDDSFRKAFSFEPKYTLKKALKSLRP